MTTAPITDPLARFQFHHKPVTDSDRALVRRFAQSGSRDLVALVALVCARTNPPADPAQVRAVPLSQTPELARRLAASMERAQQLAPINHRIRRTAPIDTHPGNRAQRRRR